MQTIYSLFNSVFSTMFQFGASLNLLFFSLLISLVATLTYKYFANQDAIKTVNDRIKSFIYELRLFDYSPALVFQALGNIFRSSAMYILYSLKPLAVLIIPVMIILMQLHYLFDYSPLKDGDVTVVSVTFADSFVPEQGRYSFEVSENLNLDTAPVLNTDTNEVSVRVSVKGDEEGFFTVNAGGTSYTKKIIISDKTVKVLPVTTSGGFWTNIANFGSDIMPSDGELTRVAVQYPDGDHTIFGTTWHWLIWLLLISMSVAIVMMKILKINW